MAVRSLCSQIHTVSYLVSPKTLCKPKALTPCFWLVMYQMAQNHRRNGFRVS